MPASVAQLDAIPNHDQEVVDLTSPIQQHSFVEVWSWNISTVILSHPLILLKDCESAVLYFTNIKGNVQEET